MTATAIKEAVRRMKAWAVANPWCDSQGIMDDEWESLAAAALGLPDPNPREEG